MGNRKENTEIPELVEKRLQEAYRQIGARGERASVWRGKLAVAAVFLMLFASVGTAYAMEGEFPLRQLFAKIWGSQTEQAAVDKVSGDVEVLKEKSTFEKLSIKPVQAVVDQMGAYVVLKVTGKDGFILEKDMVFSGGNLLYDGNDVGGYQDYVLKREDNVMYYAIRILLDEPAVLNTQPVLCVELSGGLVHAGVYQDGRPHRVYVDQGNERLGLREEDIVFRGEYEADILCKRSEDMVSVPMGDGMTADIYPLAVYVNRDLFDQMGLTSLSEEERKAHILLKDGKEVKAFLVHGQEEKSTVLELEEPVDIEQVTGIRILGETYFVE